MNYKEAFKDKKIAVIGLGPHGEMVADIKFLLRAKAQVSLYDMRSESRLKSFLPDLMEAGLTSHTLNKITGEDLLNYDLIILSPDISKRSFFLKPALSLQIPIEYPDTLFFKYAPSVTLIGVIGASGKSTVCHLIYLMLKKAFVEYKDQGLFFIDSESSHGALTHLKKIKKGDVVLVRIPEQLMEYYHFLRMSPHVAVITNPTSFELQETKKSFGLLECQTYNNFIVAPDDVIDLLKEEKRFSSKAKILRVRGGLIPLEWRGLLKGPHDVENAALALQTSELFKVSRDISRDVISTFNGLKGRIEFVKKIATVDFYNDATSVLPLSTLVAVKALAVSDDKNLTLIMGGAYTGYDYTQLFKELPHYVSTVIFLPGSGTLGLRSHLDSKEGIVCLQSLTLDEAVKKAKEVTRKGGKVVFSPGCDAVGIDASRRERGEKFVKIVRGL